MSSTQQMPWRRRAELASDAIAEAEPSDERRDQFAEAATALGTHLNDELANAGDDERRAAARAANEFAAKQAQKAGVNIDGAGVSDVARELTTEEGRTKAMRELGVHMSGRLAERYGVSDEEAVRLLEASQAMRTREGRAKVMAEYATGPTGEELTAHLTGRSLSIEDRRSAVRELLSHERVTGGLKRAGKGILIGGVILLVVLVGILIGAAALLDALVSGGADAAAFADVVTTRPDAAAFVDALEPA